jgi:hypothetical protein
MTDDEIEFIRRWTGQINVGDRFTFEGWKAAHGEAEIDFRQLVAAIRHADPRVNLIELATGPGTDGVVGATNKRNARYYRRII